MTLQSHSILGFTYKTQYAYDLSNVLTQVTYPDGRSVNYSRDALERSTAIQATINRVASPIIKSVQYRADSAPSTIVFGNGLLENRGYDPVGRLISQAIGGADTRDYAFDAVGNMLSKQTSVEADQYSYDALSRLVSEQRAQGSVSNGNAFSYDGDGNRVSETVNGAVTALSYTPNSNRLVQVGNSSLTLDAAGDTTTDTNGARQFFYSPAGRLRWVSQNGVPIAAYLYNGLGQRTGKLTLQGISLYHYDVFGRLISETTVSSQPSRDYIWNGSIPVAQVNHWLPIGNMVQLVHCTVGSDGLIDWVTYLHTDMLGTPRVGTDVAQNVVWRDDGEAFGETAPIQAVPSGVYPVYVNLRNPGQYFDLETGFFYNGARYYNPKTGRYVESDPVGLIGGINTYLYVQANPLGYSDSRGLICVWCAAGNGIAGGILIGIGEILEAPLVVAGGIGYEIGTGIYEGYEAYEGFNQSLRTEQNNIDQSVDGVDTSSTTQSMPSTSSASPLSGPNACGL